MKSGTRKSKAQATKYVAQAHAVRLFSRLRRLAVIERQEVIGRELTRNEVS